MAKTREVHDLGLSIAVVEEVGPADDRETIVTLLEYAENGANGFVLAPAEFEPLAALLQNIMDEKGPGPLTTEGQDE